MQTDFTVRFWGVRGSHPVPGKDTLYFGGSTTCLEVSVGKVTIIIDAGTGIINLGNRIAADYFNSGSKKPLELTILFSHLHHDHTQGLPFFTPLYLGQTILHLHGPRNFGDELAVVLERAMIPPNFPIDFYYSNSLKDITTVKENNIIVFEDHLHTNPTILNKFMDKVDLKASNIVVRILNDYSHPANGVFVYRIEHERRSVVFATDVEGYVFGNAKLINFAENADLLIHDAQYTREQYTGLPIPRQGFGHSIPDMAIEVGKKARVKKLVLTHHDPTAADGQLKKNYTKYKRKFQNLVYAREGQSFNIT
jgi:phosphoribosyl 1,2-cyclic phosphodiesterase